MAINWKKIFGTEDLNDGINNPNAYYSATPESALEENDGNSKMILLEPRAYSESQQIVEHLKNRNAVLVNLRRVTPDQAKRIIDFLSGAIFAISGEIQKVGGGIFLCTPNNVNIQGKITDDVDNKDTHDNDDLNTEW